MNDYEIIIKLADKGSAVAIWSIHDYLLEASNQLSDANVYCNRIPTLYKKLTAKLNLYLETCLISKKYQKIKIVKKSDCQKTTAWKILLPS